MTHGRGKKGGRGAGLKGGKGNAGGLKHRFVWMMKQDPNHFGRHGFKRHASISNKPTVINVGVLEEKFPNTSEINLTEQGFDKLLGGGSVGTNLIITVPEASSKAVEKIEAQGGKVIIDEEVFEEATSEPEEEDKE